MSDISHAEHEDHGHGHGPGCGHEAVEHGDHDDYLHDGHRHREHDGHWDECAVAPAEAGDSAVDHAIGAL